MKQLLLASLIVTGILAQQGGWGNQGTAQGLTYRATVWPQQSNSWVGRMSCDGCNPANGDTDCTIKLPILCINNAKTIDRPFYEFYPDYTTYDNPDASYYEGWVGGTFLLTDPVPGTTITSFQAGDNLCKTYYGKNSKFAASNDAYYMSYMNGQVLLIEKNWNWSQTQQGSWNMWGIFNHNDLGRVWVWSATSRSEERRVGKECRL